jgi:hypothetical protein
MRRQVPKICVLVIILLFTLSACSARVAPKQWEPLADADVNRLLTGYDAAGLLNHVQQLTAPELQGRAAASGGEELAGDYLISQLHNGGIMPWQAGGMTDYRQSFRIKGLTQTAENILAAIPGSDPDKLLVLAAHYDHLGIQSGTYYPGADDNAVGVATVLETARCFQQNGVKPLRTVLVALLSGEEDGLYGSAALAELLDRSGFADNTIVLNLDMMGGVGGNSLDVWVERSRPSGQAIANVAEQEIKASGIAADRLKRRFGPVDSQSFARRGMPSLTLSWDMAKENHPYRHSPNDTFENLRSDLIELGSKATMRVALALANYRG